MTILVLEHNTFNTSASEIYLVNIINNLGQEKAGLEIFCQENVTQISEKPPKNASWKYL